MANSGHLWGSIWWWNQTPVPSSPGQKHFPHWKALPRNLWNWLTQDCCPWDLWKSSFVMNLAMKHNCPAKQIVTWLLFPFSISLSRLVLPFLTTSGTHRFADRIATGLRDTHQTWLLTQCFSRKFSMSCVQLAVSWHSSSIGWWPGKVMENVWSFIFTLGFFFGNGVTRVFGNWVTIDFVWAWIGTQPMAN